MAIILSIEQRHVRIVIAAALVAVWGASVAAQPAAAFELPALGRAPLAHNQGEQGQAAQQTEPPQQQAPPPATTGVGETTLTPQEREALELVEQLIREQEGVLMGTGFDYDSGGRRDPFRSLVPDNTIRAPTVRPFGLPGFLISEVELKAIATSQGRWHAMVVGPNRRAYFLDVGTELFDGHVMDIRPGEVVFSQIVPDLTGARRTREVTKRLRTTDGGGETR